MKHSGFVHLHLHTQYSLLDGAIRPDALFQLAHDYKMPAVAMTDHGNIFGAVEFYQKGTSRGVKPIIGCEIYVAPGSRHDRTPPGPAVPSSYHLILLVKNANGYRNLCKLLTKAYTEGFYYRPRVDKDLLSELNEGLIALSACLHGEVSHLLVAGLKEKALEAARELSDIFTDRRFFLELQINGMEEQKKVNMGLLDISKKLKIPVVATNDCHYLKREEARVHDILLCVQTGKTVNSPDRMRFETDHFYFKSPREMQEAFRDIPDAVKNTIEIAERCNLELRLGEPHLPEFPVPADETLDSYLDKKAQEGLGERLKAMGGKSSNEEKEYWDYHERLKKEINVIKTMGFSGYFLIVSDFIDYAKSSGIPVGPGRGSAAGSLVAYSLGITNLDPIKYTLLFERFLNPDRVSLPDIDIDFCIEARDDVIKYVAERYGSENVSQIITFGQMKARAVIRDVGRVLDMPYGEVDTIAKLVPNRPDITIVKALEEEPRLKKLASESTLVKELIDVARALEGLPRHASTHAAGVVISNKPLVEYLPLYRHKDTSITTQFQMLDVEKIGLVKFDFLGLKNLTVINRTVKELKRNRGVELDINNLPPDDKNTYGLLASGNTNGIFQLESSGIKELLRKLKPGTFEDLMAAVALYRPGPLQSGMVDEFIKRKHRKVPITYELPQLKDILEKTYGVMVYQEQVMEIAKVLAGFTPGDADILRKAMGKKVPEVMLDERTKFLEGAKKKKIPQKKAERIFDLMAHFAGYGFNKSHSAAYAFIAYQTAFLKAHYPLEFMAALLSSNMGDTDKVMKYIGECKEMGIDVLPPDLNESSRDFTVRDRNIRFGLGAVKNVGVAAIESILSIRNEQPFASLIDFLSRVDSRKVNKKVVESLIKCGAFDFSGQTRARLMFSLDASMEIAQGLQRDRSIGQKSIFDVIGSSGGGSGGSSGDVPGVDITRVDTREVGEWTEKELLSYEKETLGFYISSHPLKGHERELALYTTNTTDTLRERKANEVVAVGGMVVESRETKTKKGGRMTFLRLEDLMGSVEVIVFTDLYRKSKEIIDSKVPIVVVGRLDRDSIRDEDTRAETEECKIIATDIMLLSEAKKKRPKKAHILAPAVHLEPTSLEGLKDVLKAHPGVSQVFLHLLYPEGREVVLSLPGEFKIDPAQKTVDEIKKILAGAEIRFT
jgi:DNA polymerase-3 subunit alpha